MPELTIPHSKPWLPTGDQEAFLAQLATGMIAEGTIAGEWREALKTHLDAPVVQLTASGTQALRLALRCLRADPGQNVVLPSYVCGDVLAAVEAEQLTPRFCDVQAWTMTPELTAPCIDAQTAAVILVHPFGICIGEKNWTALGVPIVEDCCQCFVPSNSVAEFTVYSFHATKILTTGEGGAITTRRNDAETSRILEAAQVGTRTTDIQAALGIAQLKHLDDTTHRRKEIAHAYCEALPIEFQSWINGHAHHTQYFRYPLNIPELDFNRVQALFAAKGVHVRRGVDALLHKTRGGHDEDFPGTIKCFDQTLSLPIYPALSQEEQQRIIDAAREIL